MKAHGCSLVLVMCVLDISEQQGAGGKGRKGWSTTVCGGGAVCAGSICQEDSRLEKGGPQQQKHAQMM